MARSILEDVRQHQNAAALKDAALRGRLGAWTRALTGVVVSACEGLGGQRSHYE